MVTQHITSLKCAGEANATLFSSLFTISSIRSRRLLGGLRERQSRETPIFCESDASAFHDRTTEN